jgi:hypothetical protein
MDVDVSCHCGQRMLRASYVKLKEWLICPRLTGDCLEANTELSVCYLSQHLKRKARLLAQCSELLNRDFTLSWYPVLPNF